MKRHIITILTAIAGMSFNLHAGLPGYLDDAFRSTRWIAYSPTGKSPMPDSVDEIKLDLKTLEQAGFGGIVTYGCDGLKREIPKLAHEAGIDFVILGIYNPENEEELKNARSLASLVDGYCVGNEGIGAETRYTMEVLKTRIEELRKWSGKPVTTSEQLEDYFSIPELLTLGDWLFPNVHPFWNRKTTEPEASKWTKAKVEELREKAGGMTVFCKEVGLPTKSLDEGVKLPDDQVQAEYYQALRVLEVPFVYFEAFDQVWKTNHPAEPFWGIFDSDRKPKKTALWLNKTPPNSAAQAEVRFTSVKDKGTLKVRKQPDGGFFNVQGTSGGLGEDRTLLLLVNVGDPAAPGWFLQLPPNGEFDIRGNGEWTAKGQIGNSQYPPIQGQVISLKVIAAPKNIAEELIDARMKNPALRGQGIYSQHLPKVPAEFTHEVTGVVVDLSTPK
jgi:exo-beta-1,3-glucanase (GH17 family)